MTKNTTNQRKHAARKSVDRVAPDKPPAKRSPSLWQVAVQCDGEKQQRKLFDEFCQRGFRCRLLNL